MFLNTEPEVAEAEAFRWAVVISRQLQLIKVCFAGVSKLCVEAINFKGGVASWQSSAVILDTVSLSIQFDFCCFNWVPPQAANQAPHVFR